MVEFIGFLLIRAYKLNIRMDKENAQVLGMHAYSLNMTYRF